jgi:hypothetical protein
METFRPLAIPGKELVDARLQCHHAVQVNTRFTRGFAPPQADDSHTSLSWDWSARALVGRESAGLQIGLRFADLTLLLRGPSGDEALPLDGRTFQDALNWLGESLTAAGFDPAPLTQPIHFELDDHPLLHGASFRLRGTERLFEELGNWYGNGALCLSKFSSPVRCWPHHFDIATQIGMSERSIGVGMSPGDASYGQPYFYVSPWPYPDASALPALMSGKWHTGGWIGAVLTADEILPEADQQKFIQLFLDKAIAAVR